jgi:hypothetical protein
MIVSTPEEWFRSKGTDFFELRPTEDGAQLPQELLDWVAAALPGRSVQRLGPSEYSGYISGGPSMEVLELNAQELAAFCARWEDADAKCIDPRWQCYQWPRQDWLDKLARVEVFEGLPPPGTVCRWFLCDVGACWFRGSYFGKGRKNFEGEPGRDDWWLVRQRLPHLKIAEGEFFAMGFNAIGHDEKRIVVYELYQERDGDVGYAGFERFSKETVFTDRIRQDLGVPEDVEITFGWL